MPAEPAPGNTRLLSRCHANFREFYRTLALATPRGSYEEADGLALISTGLPLADVNLAIATRLPADPGDAVARAVAYYRRRKHPWKLYSPHDVAAALRPPAEAMGLNPSHAEPGMLLVPIQRTNHRPAPAGLTVRIVSDQASLAAFRDTASGPLETTPDVIRALFDLSILEVPDLTLDLGEIDGRPVATAARFTSHRIAGVFVVAILPEFRRRGIGEHMTWRAALGGREEGCLASYLQSWEMGYRVYQRMGYRHVVDYATWLGRSTPRRQAVSTLVPDPRP